MTHGDPLPAAVHREWFGNPRCLSIERMTGGFSGAAVYRCRLPQETLAVRQWPGGTSVARIAEVHRVLIAARSAGCPLVPRILPTRRGETVLVVGTRCWECTGWLPGEPWPIGGGQEDALEGLESGCRAIATFHRSVSGLDRHRGRVPALQARRDRLDEVEFWLNAPLQYQPFSPAATPVPCEQPVGAWLPAAERQLKEIWRRHGARLRDRLRWYLQQTFPLQYVLRDVHRDHVLFQDRSVSGLIDFDAVRVDSPAADLARFVASFADAVPRGASIDSLWQAAVAGYRAEHPFSDQEFELARFLAEIGPLLSLVNWAVWHTTQPRAFAASPQRIAARASHLSLWLQRAFDIE